MKKLAILMGCLVASCLLANAEPSDADRKWLNAVEKIVAGGEKKVSTPSEERVKLFKEWAEKNSYRLSVTTTDKGFTIEVSKNDTSKNVAQK